MHRNEEGELVVSPAEKEAVLAATGSADTPTPTCTYLLDALNGGTEHDKDLLMEHAGTCPYCAAEVGKHYSSTD